MKLLTFDKKAKQGTVEIDSKLFDIAPNDVVIAKYVRVYLSNQREGNASVKDRSAVSGGGKKPWRQKGTGRARHGSSRSPIWRGGGVTFGPSNNVNHKLRINKKESVVAFVSVLKKLVSENKVFMVELPEFTKTRDAVTYLSSLNLKGKVTLVNLPDQGLLAAKNISYLKTKTTADLSTYDIIASGNTLFTHEALMQLLQQKESVYFKS